MLLCCVVVLCRVCVCDCVHVSACVCCVHVCVVLCCVVCVCDCVHVPACVRCVHVCVVVLCCRACVCCVCVQACMHMHVCVNAYCCLLFLYLSGFSALCFIELLTVLLSYVLNVLGK